MGTVHAKDQQHDELSKNHMKNIDDNREEFQLDNVPARVDRIIINGLARTKDDFIQETVKELFKAQDFQQLVLFAYAIRTKLESYECFKNIGIYVDTSSGPNATPYGYEVTFNVRELKRVSGGINTMVGNNEGSLVIGMKFPNVFGRAERIQTEYSYGSSKSNNFNLMYLKPILGKWDTVFSSSLYQSMSEWPWSGYRQLDRGILLDFAFNSAPLVRHNLQYDATIRDLSVLSRTTSFPVREQSGLSLKSSIRHILSLDTRDKKIFPSSGIFLKLTSELAGFGGDVGFIKNEIQSQFNTLLIEHVTIQTTGHLGFLSSVSPEKKVALCDQFFLGGPMSLRGFQTRGIGPHAEGNALGSDVYWCAGLHLFAPLPFVSPGRSSLSDLFRTHFFVNLGNVGTFKLYNLEQTFNELRQNIRIAYGLGIAASIGQVARLEINYCFPSSYQRGDQLHPGVQFGVGVHFL